MRASTGQAPGPTVQFADPYNQPLQAGRTFRPILQIQKVRLQEGKQPAKEQRWYLNPHQTDPNMSAYMLRDPMHLSSNFQNL